MAGEQSNKVVVALLDGRRMKGHVYDFSALKDHCRLFADENSPHHLGTDLKFKDLKAIFFVKDFTGDSQHQRRHDLSPQGHGKALEVTFHDGEKIVGRTEAFNPQKTGFFVFPNDPEDNNIRIFVINRNVRGVKVLASSARNTPGS
ncbi:MAG: hypothetical protein LAN63_02475 [Acidobacteriia bacterium]|nr:hypothetical protein [Terriglobia bacterium]